MNIIRSSIIDGIAINARFREKSLTALHRTLEDARSELINALQDGFSATTKAEAEAQYIMTLNAVREFHKATDPRESLKQEYQPAKSCNDTSKRIPYGYAYIQPSTVDLLYSLVVAVAAALAAGNCVLVELPESSCSELIRELLRKAIYSEVLLFTTEDPFEIEFQQKYRILVRGDMKAESHRANTLGTHVRSRVAIVDRSADMKEAARACVLARFGFGGVSAYAPDIVLVNEFFIEEFSSAVSQAALPFMSSQGSIIPSSKPQIDGTIPDSGERGTIVLLPKHKQQVIHETSAVLNVLPISSGEACINLLNKQSLPLLVNYIFAEPTTAKYLSQFIRSSLTIINHISTELLIGPAAPDGHPTKIHPRYIPEMFSIPSPVLIEQPVVKVEELIWPTKGAKSSGTLKTWLDSSLTPVKEPFGPTVGFFEQGLLFGVGVIFTSFVVSATMAIRYGYPALVSSLSR